MKYCELLNDGWGRKIGIDEHTWSKRHGGKRQTEFASLILIAIETLSGMAGHSKMEKEN